MNTRSVCFIYQMEPINLQAGLCFPHIELLGCPTQMVRKLGYLDAVTFCVVCQFVPF